MEKGEVGAGGAPIGGSGGMEGQALDVKPVSPRVSLSDLVVIAGAVALVLLGWGLKTYHDDRVTTVDLEGLAVGYPAGWLRLPVEEPDLLRAISPVNGREQYFVTSTETAQTDILAAVGGGAANPAADETAYTQLGNHRVDVDGQDAVRSDYAYVATAVGGDSPPVVIRGRQIAWIREGRVIVVALEAPESRWPDAVARFDRLVERLDA